MKINEKLIEGILIIVSCIICFPFIYNYISDSLPYCVTHVCGRTHNVGIADVIWLLTPLIAIGWLCFGGALIIVGLRDEKPVFR